MPRLLSPVLVYRRHKASNQAYCTVRLANGQRKDISLGLIRLPRPARPRALARFGTRSPQPFSPSHSASSWLLTPIIVPERGSRGTTILASACAHCESRGDGRVPGDFVYCCMFTDNVIRRMGTRKCPCGPHAVHPVQAEQRGVFHALRGTTAMVR